MSTKTQSNPKRIANLKGKRLNCIPFKKHERYRITIRSNLKPKFKKNRNHQKEVA